MVKNLNNLNTLNYLIKDELKAHREYKKMSMAKNIPMGMRKKLHEMAEDELEHHKYLKKYKMCLKSKRKFMNKS